MRFIFIGDVVGSCGCEALRTWLARLKCEYSADVAIVNGENSAEGNGITIKSMRSILDAGADVITTGNHAFHRPDISDEFERNERIIRPANYGDELPGCGVCELDFASCRAAIVNLSGTAYMPPCDNPFKYVEKLLEKIDAEMIIVDFHAEATAEKKAMGFFLAGKVSAVLGTHTHVQTADERIIDGTGYITDVGMTGAVNSVIGVKKEIAIDRFSSYVYRKNEFEKGEAEICGVFLELDNKSGKCLKIERIRKIVKA